MTRKLLLSTLILTQLSSGLIYANALSNGIVQRTVSKENVDPNTQNLDGNGREYKAGDAAKTGNTGAITAIVTGSALIGAAIPLLATGLPVPVAAGIDLMIKAGLEFAQAGADAASAGQNRDQKTLLTTAHSYSESGSQSVGSSSQSVVNSIKSQELDQYLVSQGINSDDFKSKLASGQMTNPEEMLKALGNTMPISPEDFAAGAAMANSKTNEIFQAQAEPKGNSESAAIVFNEKEGIGQGNTGGEGSTGEGSDSSSSGSVASATRPDGSGFGMSSADAIKETVQGLKAGGRGAVGSSQAPAGHASTEASAPLDMSMLVKNMFGSVQATQEATAGLLRVGLERLGITVPTSAKQNIFQMARRNFFSFGKWRKSIRVAQN